MTNKKVWFITEAGRGMGVEVEVLVNNGGSFYAGSAQPWEIGE